MELFHIVKILNQRSKLNMNLQQFINKWSENGKEDEMFEDLKMVIKDAEEEKQAWHFHE